MKVIASQIRKGNIVDLDGKLCVVLHAESFHPGKGTPTTQIDMRRISDGVKTQMRYKTTDPVERAHVEEVEYSYLYLDADGFRLSARSALDEFFSRKLSDADWSAFAGWLDYVPLTAGAGALKAAVHRD